MTDQNPLHVGLDIGSTTVKMCIYDNDVPIFEKYERHKFEVETTLTRFLQEASPLIKDRFITVCTIFIHSSLSVFLI